MTFEYLERVVVEAQIDIENIGDFNLLCRNDIGEEFYMIVRTELGWTELLEYGPYSPDLELLPLNYTVKYSRFEYNQGKLERAIDKFLNDPKRMISQAQIVEFDEIRDFLVNPIDRLQYKGDFND